MSRERFEATIAFMPATTGEMLPGGLRDLLVNDDGLIDTTLAAEYAPWEPSWMHAWATENRVWEETEAGIDVAREDYLEMYMVTPWEAELDWLRAVSSAFPSVRIALKGEEVTHAYTVHVIVQAGIFLLHNIENLPNLKNLNLRSWLGFEMESDWAGWMLDHSEISADRQSVNANIRRVLKAKTASPALLSDMKGLTLTPKQEELLKSHRNYIKDFTLDRDAWKQVDSELTL